MKRKTSYGGARPSHPYDGVILNIKKAGMRHQLMRVYTRQAGILSVFADSSHVKRQGYGSLMVLGEITFDAIEKNGEYRLTEYECRGNASMMKLTWQAYTYTQIFMEMVLNIMAPHQIDEGIYRLLIIYGRAVEVKNPRIVTLIAGWQLISRAGFYPDVDHVRIYVDTMDYRAKPVYILSDTSEEGRREIPLLPSVRELWKTVLQYSWNQTKVLHLKASDVDMIEQLLYSYFRQCSEKELKSLVLLENML